MAPSMKIFDDPAQPEESMYNNFRVYGTMLLYCMGMYTAHTHILYTLLYWNSAKLFLSIPLSLSLSHSFTILRTLTYTHTHTRIFKIPYTHCETVKRHPFSFVIVIHLLHILIFPYRSLSEKPHLFAYLERIIICFVFLLH